MTSHAATAGYMKSYLDELSEAPTAPQ